MQQRKQKATNSDDNPQEKFLSDARFIYNATVPIHFTLYWVQLPEGEDCANLYKNTKVLL